MQSQSQSFGSSGNFTSPHANGQFQWQSQFQPYIIGLMPVLFVPHCMPPNGNPNQIPGQYMQVSYPCAQCNQSNGRDALTAEENFSSSDSFQQVLAQAGVNSLDAFVRTQPRRMRMRKQKRIQQKVDTQETQSVDPKTATAA